MIFTNTQITNIRQPCISDCKNSIPNSKPIRIYRYYSNTFNLQYHLDIGETVYISAIYGTSYRRQQKFNKFYLPIPISTRKKMFRHKVKSISDMVKYNNNTVNYII